MQRSYSGFLLVMAMLFSVSACGERDDTKTPKVDQIEQAAKPEADEALIPFGRLPEDVKPTHYELDLKIDPSRDHFSGIVKIEVQIAKSTSLIWFHGRDLDVTDAKVTSEKGDFIVANYQQVHGSGVARLDLESEVSAGKAIIQISYTGPFSKRNSGLFSVDRGGNAYALTQFEAISARMAFPGFDEPAFKVPFDIALTTRKEDVAITTTPLLSSQDQGDGWTRHIYKTTRPLPTYLLAFVVGPYDLVEGAPVAPNALRATALPLRGASVKGKGDQFAFALNHTRRLVEILEDYFQIPFPYAKLDSIAAPDFFGGAMENVGAIIAHETLLVMEEDAPLSQRRASVSVHAHEIAHQWFGNLVTPVWWDDIWLNEAFATWMGNKASHAFWPEGGFDRSNLRGALSAMASDSLASARQIRQPVTHNNNISNAFDGITYRKGGGVLRMFEGFMGEEAFRKGVQLHMRRFADGVASSDDFMQSLADGAGQPDIVPSFRSYIDQPGIPLLATNLDCSDPRAPKLQISQSRYRPLGSPIEGESQWIVPFTATYQVAGEKYVLRKMIEEKTETLDLEGGACPDFVLPNANGAGYYRFQFDEADWAKLAGHTHRLSVPELLVYADSLMASFKAGKASATVVLEGLKPLVDHEDWAVVSAVVGHFRDLTEKVLDEDMREHVDPVLTTMVNPRFERLKQASSEKEMILQTTLIRFLALVSRDPEIRTELLQGITAKLGLDGASDPSALSKELVAIAIAVGVQERGAPFFDKVVELTKASDDQAFRGSAIKGLGFTEDPILVAQIHKEVISDDLTRTERMDLLEGLLAREATRDLTWSWINNKFEELLESRGGGPFAGYLVGPIGNPLCQPKQAEELKALVAEYEDRLPGHERSLAQALERISLCVTLKEKKAKELKDAFEDLEQETHTH